MNTQFGDYTNEKLNEIFNREVGIKTWTTSRGIFLEELKNELLKRNIGAEILINGKSFSLSKRIQILNNKLSFE